jgi:hypothetical protein
LFPGHVCVLKQWLECFGEEAFVSYLFKRSAATLRLPKRTNSGFSQLLRQRHFQTLRWIVGVINTSVEVVVEALSTVAHQFGCLLTCVLAAHCVCVLSFRFQVIADAFQFYSALPPSAMRFHVQCPSCEEAQFGDDCSPPLKRARCDLTHAPGSATPAACPPTGLLGAMTALVDALQFPLDGVLTVSEQLVSPLGSLRGQVRCATVQLRAPPRPQHA